MTPTEFSTTSGRIYRVDKFVVPNQARGEFLTKVRETHALLNTQPGFIQDLVLEQPAGPGEFNLVTLVEWDSAQAVENARAAVLAMRQRTGFDPQEMFARLGIRADLANYRRIDA
jgi:heme-degrading monooxygenase HmoA